MPIITGFFCSVLCALAPGQVTIDSTSVVWVNGARVGGYVDDEAPMQAEELAGTSGLRLAGIAPNTHGLPAFPGAIRLREFYPYTLNERPRKGDGYILPATYHPPGAPPYTMRWRQKMWCWAKERHPVMVVWYGWSERLGPRIQALMAEGC